MFRKIALGFRSTHRVQHAKAVLFSFLVAMTLVAMNAQAALTLDSAAILADVATVVGFITTVGLAILGLVYVAKVIGWAKKAG